MAQTQTMPRQKFLTIAVNLLHKALLEANRTDAKQIYRELEKGTALQLTKVQMEDKSTVRFDLSLDHTEFRGNLNYGAFRASLLTLVANISQALREEKDITVFTANEDPNVMIFGVTGVTFEDEQPNVMVLSADAGTGQPSVLLRLMYLDYSQFPEARAQVAAAEGSDEGESETS